MQQGRSEHGKEWTVAHRQTAEHYYDQAVGDPDAARELAARDGWRF